MKKFLLLITVLSLAMALFSCKSMVLDGVSSGLSGANKKGVPAKVKEDSPNPMDAFLGEDDPKIVQEVLPTIVKLYEIMYIENPTHQGLSIMCGTLNVMYANLCVQSNAETMTDPRLLDEQVAEYDRARLHYLKGRDYILQAFDERFPGFKETMLGNDEEKIKQQVSNITLSDVNAVYWACAGSLASFALNPLDSDALTSLRGPVAMLEKAALLDPDYSAGAIWDVLSQFYAAAPMDFGGDYERAVFCHNEAMRVSKKKSPSLYITYAESFCKPSGDKDGFVNALNTALSLNPDENPSGKLMAVLAQQKAKRLLDNIDDYFVEW